MDPLSDIFRTLRIRSTLYFRAALGAPWGLDVPDNAPVVRFHVVVDGACYISVKGREPVRLRRGDLAMVPHGAQHDLLSSPDASTPPVAQVLEETSYDGQRDLCYGGSGEKTILVCGHFEFEDEASHPIFKSLPDFIHIQAETGHDFVWLDAATRTLGREAAKRPPGWQVVVDRTSEILFIQILRIQFAQKPSGVVAAFLDDQLSLALGAIHGEPQLDWNVEKLGRMAGMSRTAFAVRFRELMGMPPMAYLSQWRLQRARLALLESNRNVASIAELAGYKSEAAFSRAFHQLYGAPPATYRRQQKAVAPGTPQA